MPRPLHVALVALLLSGLLVAGCGGGGKKTAKKTTSTKTHAKPASTPATTSSSPAVQQAVASCQQTIDANSQLSDSAKKDLKGICQKAASGDAAGVRKAAREVCIRIVKDTVPSGSAQDQAVSACKT